jgi:hypothetical protein
MAVKNFADRRRDWPAGEDQQGGKRQHGFFLSGGILKRSGSQG